MLARPALRLLVSPAASLAPFSRVFASNTSSSSSAASAALRRKMAAPILRVHARQIFDSRGQPTVEVDVTTAKGASGGEHEGVVGSAGVCGVWSEWCGLSC